MATFTHFVFNTASENPPQLGPSLSGANNEVILRTTSSVVSGKTVTGILYNSIEAAAANVSLSANSGSNLLFDVHSSYHGATFALYFSDRSTTLFTVNTATATQVLSGSIGYDNRGPNARRKFAVEY